ncbi:hypothetical protein ONZ51_g2359 [Trametes cubensis]|uniref:Uncharacterized protein n=1 Tax=Trametes cubensis TaxID=1111947 RepID=A0AAD7TZW6_9APHY|nr:hypothetical protein ONZ51_g2359 [Trametes cubensis]
MYGTDALWNERGANMWDERRGLACSMDYYFCVFWPAFEDDPKENEPEGAPKPKAPEPCWALPKGEDAAGVLALLLEGCALKPKGELAAGVEVLLLLLVLEAPNPNPKGLFSVLFSAEPAAGVADEPALFPVGAPKENVGLLVEFVPLDEPAPNAGVEEDAPKDGVVEDEPNAGAAVVEPNGDAVDEAPNAGVDEDPNAGVDEDPNEGVVDEEPKEKADFAAGASDLGVLELCAPFAPPKTDVVDDWVELLPNENAGFGASAGVDAFEAGAEGFPKENADFGASAGVEVVVLLAAGAGLPKENADLGASAGLVDPLAAPKGDEFDVDEVVPAAAPNGEVLFVVGAAPEAAPNGEGLDAFVFPPNGDEVEVLEPPNAANADLPAVPFVPFVALLFWNGFAVALALGFDAAGWELALFTPKLNLGVDVPEPGALVPEPGALVADEGAAEVAP